MPPALVCGARLEEGGAFALIKAVFGQTGVWAGGNGNGRAKAGAQVLGLPLRRTTLFCRAAADGSGRRREARLLTESRKTPGTQAAAELSAVENREPPGMRAVAAKANGFRFWGVYGVLYIHRRRNVRGRDVVFTSLPGGFGGSVGLRSSACGIRGGSAAADARTVAAARGKRYRMPERLRRTVFFRAALV